MIIESSTNITTVKEGDIGGRDRRTDNMKMYGSHRMQQSGSHIVSPEINPHFSGCSFVVLLNCIGLHQW